MALLSHNSLNKSGDHAEKTTPWISWHIVAMQAKQVTALGKFGNEFGKQVAQNSHPYFQTRLLSKLDVSKSETSELSPVSVHLGFGLGIFLVSVPVFFQAPLVRCSPVLSLALTLVWVGLGWFCLQQPKWRDWGDILLGFAWSWLAGSVYWGWFRMEPLWHIPIEALGFPFAIVALRYSILVVGHGFYLGSLLGTVVTDLFFYKTGVIAYWRPIMQADVLAVPVLLREAAIYLQNWESLVYLGICLVGLLGIGVWAWRINCLHWAIFGGAVVGTILVDVLFGLAAVI